MGKLDLPNANQGRNSIKTNIPQRKLMLRFLYTIHNYSLYIFRLPMGPDKSALILQGLLQYRSFTTQNHNFGSVQVYAHVVLSE